MPNGKICYLEIPTTNVDTSVGFYSEIFTWKIRVRGDGQRAFDDSTGAVSGTWLLNRTPARDNGILIYIMVDDISATLDAVSKSGGEVVTPRTAIGRGNEAFATFRDPSGNLLGLYQEH